MYLYVYFLFIHIYILFVCVYIYVYSHFALFTSNFLLKNSVSFLFMYLSTTCIFCHNDIICNNSLSPMDKLHVFLNILYHRTYRNTFAHTETMNVYILYQLEKCVSKFSILLESLHLTLKIYIVNVPRFYVQYCK